MITASIPRVVVSGLRGGGGKTIFSLSLLSLWRKAGLKAVPFKKGPDYIDAGWLAKAAGTPCYNLDLFMMSSLQVVHSFLSHSGNAQVAVIEGNRGLYDGVDHKGTYSTAALAKLLCSPVILVVDCTKSTNTIAALVLGCLRMDPQTPIRGVVLNRVATGRQESLIRTSIEGSCALPVLGAIPRLPHDPLPERHMGLTPFHEHEEFQRSLNRIAEMGEQYLNLGEVQRITESARTFVSDEGEGDEEAIRFHTDPVETDSSVTVGIIRDSAFQFYYEENLEELRKRGASLVEVSPLTESSLPEVDALYIGGGFPETHAIALSENVDFMNSMRDAVEEGLPVYAECGGLMYLGTCLVADDKEYPMAGILPAVFRMEKKPQAHGYTIIEIDRTNPYFSKGSVLRGHEFHYSRVTDLQEDRAFTAFHVQRGRGIHDGRDGLCYRNVLAAYTHVHALGTPEWADGMIRCARHHKRQKKGIRQR